MKNDLLLELQLEELPTRAVLDLSASGEEILQKSLQEKRFNFKNIKSLQTPRRLAWIIFDLEQKQENIFIERKGPAIERAKNQDGSWSQAALGFAKSCGVAIEALQEKDGYLFFAQEQQGKNIQDCLGDIFKNLIDELPIAKRMRWGNNQQSFVRPVNSIIALYGEEIIPLEFFGIKSSNQTKGHRVHAPEALRIKNPQSYEQQLAQAFVIADINQRKALIQQQINDLCASLQMKALVDEDLLQEVASLLEFPVAIIGDFEEEFLQIPREVLITTMRDNQKTFAVTDLNGNMLPKFIAISNLKSERPEVVKKGNEKVIRPRFADAKFFWEQDLKHGLDYYVAKLVNVTYQAKLGTLADKSRRLSDLLTHLADYFNLDNKEALRVAELAKADLLSEMVMEFPELQGIMGKYYARAQGENEAIAIAIEEHYLPLGANSELPKTQLGSALSLAEKVDIITSAFAIGAQPTGSKDPYAVRRQAISIIRIVLENKLSLDLNSLFSFATGLFPPDLKVSQKNSEILHYILERLNFYYRERGVEVNIFQAVQQYYLDSFQNNNFTFNLLDFDARISALQAFLQSPEALPFLESAKRIRNILRKNQSHNLKINPDLLEESVEKQLFQFWMSIKEDVKSKINNNDYLSALYELNKLNQSLSSFFENIMVISENENLRNNRLALLTDLQLQFAAIAELSLL